MALLVMVGAAVIFAAAFVAFRPLLLRMLARHASTRDAAPVPARWEYAVRETIPQSRTFSRADRTRLLASVRNMVTTLHWEGCGGLALTEDMQVAIASQASLLALHLPGEPFPRLREILVYPRTFVARRAHDPRAWIDDHDARSVPELGEAWSNGVIVLSWEGALDGARRADDGRNVVYHEFAHQLAFEHALVPDVITEYDTQQVPSASIVPNAARWIEVLRKSYDELCSKTDAGEASVLDSYGTTNLSEFFAVATESFFEQPRDVRDEYSALYAELCALYRQDPASWDAGTFELG